MENSAGSSPLSTNATRQLDVLGHDGLNNVSVSKVYHALRMDSKQVGVLEEAHKIGFLLCIRTD